MLITRKGIARGAVLLSMAAQMAFAGIALADDGSCGGEQFGKQQQHNLKKIGKKLGLTDAQKAQAKEIFQANKETVKPITTNLQAERKNLQALINADIIDEAAIRTETAKIAGIQADLNVNRAKVGAQFRAILTPSQLETLKTLHKKRIAKEKDKASPNE